MTPSFASVEVGQPIPAEGSFEFLKGGKYVGAVTRHPRSNDDWMAFVKPKHWRESGMKRFKTRNGAIRYVLKCLGS